MQIYFFRFWEDDEWHLLRNYINEDYEGRERSSKIRQLYRIRAWLENKPIQKRSGRYSYWVEDIISKRIGDALGIHTEEARALLSPYAEGRLRALFVSFQDLLNWLSIVGRQIPPEYLAIVPQKDGWAVYTP